MTNSIPDNPPPNESNGRISHLDILRGFALLGILLMNIQSFAMPSSAYINPASWGDFEGINFWVWAVNNVFADAKFMTIFSMLFGAGICLFAENAERKHGKSTSLHYQRNFWLLLFGITHAYLIWHGDILYTYALCAFIAYWARNLSVKWLLIWAMVGLMIASGYYLLVQWVIQAGEMPQEALNEIQKFWHPDDARQQKEIQSLTGSVIDQFNYRVNAALFIQVDLFFSYSLWRVNAAMFIGMALYKTGVLSGLKSTGFYLKMTLVGLVCGLSLSAYGVTFYLENNFAMATSMFGGAQFNFWGSMFTALGYIGLLHLIIKRGFALGLQRRLAAVGQMAFTNYMMQSLLCTFIFYGHGFALFGELDRASQMLVVLFVWALQLWYSPLWLNRYRYGPLEWGWRSLTYKKRQPMTR